MVFSAANALLAYLNPVLISKSFVSMALRYANVGDLFIPANEACSVAAMTNLSLKISFFLSFQVGRYAQIVLSFVVIGDVVIDFSLVNILS